MNAWTTTALAELTPAERQVADLLPIEADTAEARAVLNEVPFWFHTFALNRAEEIYAPGYARDHRYRVPAIPESFEGLSVLDIGSFDGFYAFLAEARGAERVVAVDNEQYLDWVRARWGIELEGGEGFRAIHRLLGSGVEYRKLDAFDLDRLGESFDFIFCCGILHRVEAPTRLLEVLSRRLAVGGRVPRRRRPGPPLRPGRGLSPRRLRLLGVHRGRDRDARPQERLPGLRVDRFPGDRRPPADHRLAESLSDA